MDEKSDIEVFLLCFLFMFKGMWSLPGGKIEVGEESLAAAKRELHEETGLGSESLFHEKEFDFLWCEDGPICTTDSIHKTLEDVKFHYVISQWFVEIKRKSELDMSQEGLSPSEPRIVASDDAADASWWSLRQIQSGIKKGEITSGVEKVILRTELMYSRGLLS